MLRHCLAARCILAVAVRSRVMEPMPGLTLREHALRAGTARKVTARSACYRIFMLRTCGDLSKLWNRAVDQIEQSKSIEAAANALRTDDITLPSAIRWARRRLRLVHTALESVVRAAPERFRNCQPNLSSFQFQLKVSNVLPELREVAAAYLHLLPSPLGFAYSCRRHKRFQHETGPDPPNPLA